MTIFQAIIIAIVEGLTEFLPVSSTGHMIITTSIMGISADKFTKLFTIAIQFGTILSVLVLYWRKFLQSFSFYVKLIVAFIPAAIFGLLLSDWIDSLLENVIMVAVMLILGGIVFILIDKWLSQSEDKIDEDLSFVKVFKIGLFQCIAMIPGVSRSAATIIGGVTQGLSKRQAAEFSFFLAVPTMFAATCKKMLDYHKVGTPLNSTEWGLLGIGNLVGFIVAIIAIKSFINYITKNGFKVFGYYRIIVGAAILILYFLGIELSVI
ncbi:MAG: undecaprenyl-diphosphate phosphatase [Sphingobacteriales bacterium]|nr:undecaprenyl-diphosphate phosphatase [Sphingobacteriales bacterium]